MTNGPTKTDANADKVKGTVKEHTLGLFDDQKKTEGQAQHAEGDAQYKAAETKGWVEGAYDNVAGTIKNVVGQVTGDHSTEAKGKAQDTKGDAKRAANS